MARILIVEDDKALSKMIAEWLAFEKHKVDQNHHGSNILEQLDKIGYELIILDWNLPFKSGLDLCRQMRARGITTKILMLTANNEVDEKTTGLNAGADDYLTKPFHIKELALRVNALLRRPSRLETNVLQFRELTLHPETGLAILAGKEIELWPIEFALMGFFMRHRDQVFTAEDLLDHVWSSSSDATTQAVTTCIKRLRQKLDRKNHPSYITTVHGLGYKLGS